jgi:hypothetical protein
MLGRDRRGPWSVRPALGFMLVLGMLAAHGVVQAQSAPPSAPTTFQAGPATTSSVSMTWSAVTGATFYQVAYRPNTVTTYTVANAGTQTIYTVTGLVPGTNVATVFAYVDACNTAGCSPWTGYLTLQALPTVPPTPPNLRAGTATTSSAQVLWDTSLGATDYQIAYRLATGCQSGCAYNVVDAGNLTSYTISNLPASTTVYAYVEACNGSACSGWEGYLTLQTLASTLPAPPTNLRGGTATASSVQLLWGAVSTATDYNVAYRLASGCQSGCTYTVVDAGSQASYTITGLPASTTVYAYVEACNNVGCSSWVGYATVQTTAVPPAALAFTSYSSTSFAVGRAGTFTVTASGSPTPTLSESASDTLPGGVTFNASSGVLSGTPAAGSAPTYTLHFTAHNGAGSDVTQTFTLTVIPSPPPTVTYYFAGAMNDPFGTIAIGTPFCGSFAYVEQPTHAPAGSDLGEYIYSTFSVTLAGTTVTDNGTGVINVYDDPYPTDLFNLYTSAVSGALGGWTLTPAAGMEIDLQDVSRAVFTSPSLPGPGLTLSNFTPGEATFLQLQTQQVMPTPQHPSIARGNLTALSSSPIAGCTPG